MSLNTSIEDSLLQLLLCPVCLDHCQAPIFTCVNGHSLCSDCKKRMQNCPVCRADGTPAIRNLALDVLSDQVLNVPCKFKTRGCGVKRRREEDLEGHYKICKFQFDCKCLAEVGCDFVGSRYELYEHVIKEHLDSLVFIGELYWNFVNEGDKKEYCSLYKLEGEEEYFWIFFRRLFPKKIICFVRYIGPDENAYKFKVDLTITSADGKTTVLRFIRKPIKLEEEVLDSRDMILIEESFFDLIPTVGREVDFTLNSVTKIQ